MVIGSWKIIAILLPRILRICGLALGERSSPSKKMPSLVDCRGAREQAHDRKRGDRFARSRLADDAECLARRRAKTKAR